MEAMFYALVEPPEVARGPVPRSLHFYLDGSMVDHHAGAAVVMWSLRLNGSGQEV